MCIIIRDNMVLVNYSGYIIFPLLGTIWYIIYHLLSQKMDEVGNTFRSGDTILTWTHIYRKTLIEYTWETINLSSEPYNTPEVSDLYDQLNLISYSCCCICNSSSIHSEVEEVVGLIFFYNVVFIALVSLNSVIF